MAIIRPKRGPSRLTACADQQLERLRKQVVNEFEHLSVECAPVDASYVVMSLSDGLDNERVLTAGDGINIDDGGPGRPVIISADGAAGAFLPLDGSDAMTGDLDMGGNEIGNVGNVDGVDVSAHAASTTAHGISAFGATLVDDASAAAARTTLGAAASGSIGSSGLTMSTSRVLGRSTAGTGVVEQLTIGGGLSFSGTSIRISDITDVPMGDTDVLLGDSSGSGVVEVISVGTGLSLSGGVLALDSALGGFAAAALLVLTSTTSIANTTTPTDILSTSVAANAVGSGHALRVRLFGDLFNNTGGNRSWRIELRLNGVTLWDDSSQLFASNAQRRAWSLDFSIFRVTSTTCWLGGQGWNTITSATAPTTGLGAADSTGVTGSPVASDPTTDPTVAWGSAQTLQVRITADNTGANCIFRRRGGYVEII